MKILEDYLALHAQQQPQKIAVVSEGEECTYAELYQRVCRRAEEIRLSSLSSSIPFPLDAEYRFSGGIYGHS